MDRYRFNWKIGGKAGEGIQVTSFLLTKLAQRCGLFVFEYGEYPSLIRGGHTTGQVVASTDPVYCQQYKVDVMVILNEETIRVHLDEFSPTTLFLIDTQDDKVDFSQYPTIASTQIISVPMVAMSREATGKSLASNVVSLGVCCYMFGLPYLVCEQVIKDFFAKKGQEVIDENLRALEKGYTFAVEQKLPQCCTLPTTQEKEQLLLTGTEAMGLGALSAGIGFYSAYPMTPASNLMHFMADAHERHTVVVKHAEDEIAAINEALGAAYAGVRAMTGTAGGGFALMVEAVSLAGVTELPLVVLVGGRPGPATGLPTWTSQTDLSFVLNAGHGEFPRIVFTPGNLDECFKLTRLSFLLAEKYHTQAYLIVDKLLLESRMTTTPFPSEYTNTRYSMAQDPLPEDDSYRRFEITKEGYSPRSVPGQPHGLQLTNSYEHDEHGYATEDATLAKSMVEKRMRKLDGILMEAPPPILIGPSTAKLTFVTWGSSRLVVEEMLNELNAKQPGTANCIHIMTMFPFHVDTFSALANNAQTLVMVEENFTKQGEMHIRMHTGIQMHHRVNRYDGRPLYTENLREAIQSLI